MRVTKHVHRQVMVSAVDACPRCRHTGHKVSLQDYRPLLRVRAPRGVDVFPQPLHGDDLTLWLEIFFFETIRHCDELCVREGLDQCGVPDADRGVWSRRQNNEEQDMLKNHTAVNVSPSEHAGKRDRALARHDDHILV